MLCNSNEDLQGLSDEQVLLNYLGVEQGSLRTFVKVLFVGNKYCINKLWINLQLKESQHEFWCPESPEPFSAGNRSWLQLQNNLFFPQLPCLNSYDSYCSNQVAAKALLDHKKQDHRVQDFLQRCLESPFSRKLDLWNFLDIPRSRLVKYPLLLREILRHTPNDHPDQQHLEEAVSCCWVWGFLGDYSSFILLLN